MKTLLISATIAMTAGTGAFAAPTASNIDLQSIENYAPQADVASLSNGEVRTLLNIIHSGDSVAEIRAKVKSFLAS